MKYVEIYQLQDNGSQKVILTCKLQGQEVVFQGYQEMAAELKQNGIPGNQVDHNERLYPKDGERFLQNLKYSYKSGYYNASDVLKK